MIDRLTGLLRPVLEWVQGHRRQAGIIGIIVIAVFAIASARMWHYAESSEFCGSCHEMYVHYDSFKTSKHNNEHVHNCHACHVGPGLKGFLHAKLSDGLHDTIEHMRDTYGREGGPFIDIAPDSIAIINGNCEGCHSKGYTEDENHLKLVSTTMRKVDEGMAKLERFACTDCHFGLVHPHTAGDLFKVYQEYAKDPAKKVQPFGTFKDYECLACHKTVTPKAVKEWMKGGHAAKGVTCEGCHGNNHTVITERHGQVPANVCGPCHEKSYNDFRVSKHVQGRLVAEWGEGQYKAYTKDLDLPGCRDCHKFSLKHEWDPVGENCASCHMGHEFSRVQASSSGACEKCHVGGPDHSQLDMKAGSIHGRIYVKWGEKPTCQTCHGEKTHNFEKVSEAFKTRL